MTTETKIAKFEIRRCHGTFVDFVEIPVCTDIDECDLRYEYTSEVLDAAGIVNYTCDGCYDQAYRAEFVEWVKSTESNDCGIACDEDCPDCGGADESTDYVGDYVI